MHSSEDLSLFLIALPPRIAAMFESRERLDFVNSKDHRGEIIECPAQNKSSSQGWIEIDSRQTSGGCAGKFTCR